MTDGRLSNELQPKFGTVVSAVQVIWQVDTQRATTRRVISLMMEIMTAPSAAERMCRLYFLGTPFAVALCQVLRATGLHGSSLITGAPPAVVGIANQRNTMGDLFDVEGGQISVYAQMVGRYLERLFGFSPTLLNLT